MAYIKRHAESIIKRLSTSFSSILITGARQTGKTTILNRCLADKNVPYATFDDIEEEYSAKNDPKNFLAMHKYPYIFDEVQYVPELFRYLKIEIDKEKKKGMYYLTGSQQFALSAKASESLAGRIGIIQLLPLSLREIRGDDYNECFLPSFEYISKRTEALKGYEYSIKETWNNIFLGGYPAVVSGELSLNDFFQSYIKTYIERDIKSVLNIANEMQFLQFIRVLAARVSGLLNINDISSECGISEVTAKKWLSLLESSGIIFFLCPYSSNVEKRVIKTPKLYFSDVSMAAYLTKWGSPETMESGAMSGAFFENYVVSEIYKSFLNNNIEPSIYFYRDKDKVEIDLIIEDNGTIYPVEIKKTATPKADDAKNFSVINRIKNIKVSQPVIVCNTNNVVFVKNGSILATAIPVSFI